VAIFFAISGFCIHLSHANSGKASAAEFLIRRWFRIYPPFLIALLFFALVFPHSRVDLHTKYGVAEFFSHFFLLQNLDARLLHGINVAWWSVAVEFQLYLLYPLLLAIARRYGWQRALMLTASIEIGLRLTEAIWRLTGHPRLPTFLLDSPFYFWFSWTSGAIVAEAFIRKTPFPFKPDQLPLWIALAIAADLFRPLSYFSFTFVALATTTALVGYLQRRGSPARNSGITAAHLNLAGLCSYSIYLIHQPLVEVVPVYAERIWPSLYQQPLLMFVVCLGSWILVLPIAWLMYRLVEIPGMALGKAVIHFRRTRMLGQLGRT
jgi:peptidoglycan/LPS O-acetylase OafA/YrhL